MPAYRTRPKTSPRPVLPVLPVLPVVLAVLALLVLAAPSAHAFTTRGFTMDLPAGWQAVPEQQVADFYTTTRASLEARSGYLRAAMERSTPFEYAVEADGAANGWFSSPYLIVDYMPGADTTRPAERLNTDFKQELITFFGRLSGAAPFILYERYDDLDRVYSLELKYTGTTGPVCVAINAVYTPAGVYYLYWMMDAADYGLYVDTVREAVSSITPIS